jgi:3-methyladenine DNA glycosylase AlkD
MINTLKQIRDILTLNSTISEERHTIFFKAKPGEYGEHDQFIGVTVPTLRKISKEWLYLSTAELTDLLQSPFNEERLLALLIMIWQYSKGTQDQKGLLHHMYMSNLTQINNWNLVDTSAPILVGAHLLHKDRGILLELCSSENLWARRIAIISTLYFIRNHDLEWTFKLALKLLNDKHDLIHKAVGWMLREAGKQDEKQLLAFIEQHEPQMPRTMFRYAMEHQMKKRTCSNIA